MVRAIVRAYPRARTIHLVVDNLNTHREKALTDTFGPREGHRLWRRLTVHYTPIHGSWLNQAEIAFSLFTRQCLGRQRIEALTTLRRDTRATRQRTTINRQFTRKEARRRFGYQKPVSKRSEYELRQRMNRYCDRTLVHVDFRCPLRGAWMDLDLEQLAAAVLLLPDAARADLAARLLESLESDVPGDSAESVASAWEVELDRREAELAADPSVGIPAAEVFRVLGTDLAAQRAARSETVR